MDTTDKVTQKAPASPGANGGPRPDADMMDFEEFKAMYLQQQQQRRQTTLAAQPQQQQPAPAPEPAAPRPNIHSDVLNFMRLLVNWVFDHLAQDFAFLIQYALAAVILNTRFTWSTLGFIAAHYAFFTTIRLVFQTVHLRRQTNTQPSRSPVGLLMTFIKPRGTDGGYSTWAKVLYIVLKSVEALFVSLSPSYSTDLLEREITGDGVLVPAAPPQAVTAAFPTAAAPQPAAQ